MPRFEKPQQPELAKAMPRSEPPELARFMAGADVTAPPKLDDRTRRGGPGLEMNVRFTAEEKAALQKLAQAEDRSQQQVLMRLAGPLVLEAARQLG